MYACRYLGRKAATCRSVVFLFQEGDTALHIASANDHVFTMRWLVESGISVNVRNTVVRACPLFVLL